MISSVCVPHVHVDLAGIDAVLPTCMAAAGVVGLFLWSYAGWWLLLAVCSMGQTLRQGIPFTLGWWGAVAPLGSFSGEMVLDVTMGRDSP